jgi:nucleotide-binding universal stress UspA family protein
MRHAALGSEGPSSSTIPGDGAGGSVRRFLVPVDASGLSAAALALAIRLCSDTGGMLRVVHVRIFDPPVRSSGRFYPETSEAATEVLDNAVGRGWRSGTKASGVVVEAERSHIAQAICAVADDWNADVVVIARRPRRGITRLAVGSVADRVIRHANCPVLVVRPGRS